MSSPAPPIAWRVIWTFYDIAHPAAFAKQLTRGFRADLGVRRLALTSGPDGSVTITSSIHAESAVEAASVLTDAVATLADMGDQVPTSMAAVVVLPR